MYSAPQNETIFDFHRFSSIKNLIPNNHTPCDVTVTISGGRKKYKDHRIYSCHDVRQDFTTRVIMDATINLWVMYSQIGLNMTRTFSIKLKFDINPSWS